MQNASMAAIEHGHGQIVSAQAEDVVPCEQGPGMATGRGQDRGNGKVVQTQERHMGFSQRVVISTSFPKMRDHPQS